MRAFPAQATSGRMPVVAELAEIAVPLDRLPRKHLDGSLDGFR